MINLNNYRKNIFQNYGVKECPYYSEDGVILKIFEEVNISKKPMVVEFGEHRVLGTTTRAFRIKYFSRSIYFSGNYNFKSFYLNIFDLLKCAITKNLLFLKFLFNFPFKFFVTPDNIISLFNKKNVKKIDLICVDIDSYDYFIAKKILQTEYSPTLFIIEYNCNLPIDRELTLTYMQKRKNNNKRIYGASFLAIYNLFKKYNYKLIHISGFNNLYFIKNKFGEKFLEPDYNKEIPKNDEQVKEYINKYCQKSFLPSWYGEKYLTDNDLLDYKKI